MTHLSTSWHVVWAVLWALLPNPMIGYKSMRALLKIVMKILMLRWRSGRMDAARFCQELLMIFCIYIEYIVYTLFIMSQPVVWTRWLYGQKIILGGCWYWHRQLVYWVVGWPLPAKRLDINQCIDGAQLITTSTDDHAQICRSQTPASKYLSGSVAVQLLVSKTFLDKGAVSALSDQD